MVLNLYDHTVRKALCLSLNEYAVACEILALSNNEAFGGWCIKSKENISETLDLSRPTIQKIINTLEEKAIIKRKSNGWLRTVDEFNNIMSARDVNLLISGDFNVLTICKESLQPTVKKVNNDCKESLQLGVKKVNTSITVSNNSSNNNKEKEIFEEFRKNYKGTKRGLETEFKCFQKHKDWREVLPLLLTALTAEERHRKLAADRGEFFPHRCNLSTWLNQRRWETEHGELPVKRSEKPRDEWTENDYLEEIKEKPFNRTHLILTGGQRFPTLLKLL